MACDMKNAIS